ncbi:MAG: DUF1295 domain-containing protein [Polyangiaceae bacterium]|nr:DUF1295 domain-containing protein [Polyangiaceae bacterium]
MLSEESFNRLVLVEIGAAIATALLLLFITAPYGRHARQGWGVMIPAKWAWLVMEMPASLGFLALYFLGSRAFQAVPLIFCAIWQLHYLQRTFVYPVLQRGLGRPWPLLVALSGFSFQCLNGFVNARWISERGSYDLDWLWSPQFLVGVFLFLVGFWINMQSDAILRRLRQPGDSSYHIPSGGMYRWVSCPNYFGEILEWTGWAVMTWSLPGLAFALYTIANLGPRALAHHRWYQKEFSDYPAQRKALIPFLI